LQRRLKQELSRLNKLEAALHSSPSTSAGASAGAGAQFGAVTADQALAVFNEFDADRSGFIDKHELGLLAAALGAPLDEADLAATSRHLDANGDGRISFAEFFQWFSTQSRALPALDSGRAPLQLAVLRARLWSRAVQGWINRPAGAWTREGSAAARGNSDMQVIERVNAQAAQGIKEREADDPMIKYQPLVPAL
jgi:hypothetical protein